MLTREPDPDRYKVHDSELFEAAFNKRCVHLPRCEDIYLYLTWRLERGPEKAGVFNKIISTPARGFFTTITPPLVNMPIFWVLYEVDKANRVVTLWNIVETAMTPMIL